MKMIMAIVGKDDEMETSAQLVAKGYFVTKIATSGGFLKRKHVTLMIGTEDEKVDQAISIRRAFEKKGIEMDGDSMTNQQFAVLTQEQMEKLGQKYAYEIWERHEDGRDVVRFCTSWAT